MPKNAHWPVHPETKRDAAARMGALTLSFLLLLTACAPAATTNIPETASPTTGRTSTPQPSITPQATDSPTPPPPSPSASPRPNCVEMALFVADVTINDNTRIEAGKPFTKTWQLRNAGTCSWDAGYTLHFLKGDKMDSPDAVPLAETASNATLNLSVDLKAPSRDGSFTALFEIRNPQGKPIRIGLTTSIWAKIMVGNVVVAVDEQPTSTTVPGQPQPTARPTAKHDGPCQPQQSGTGLIDLINTARQNAGLRPLNENAKLSAAAQAHSDDMACNNNFSHTGTDGSSIQDRIVASGYNPSDWGEIIYAGGSAQQAFDWWMNDTVHHDMMMNPNMRDVGEGYTYVTGSEYGGYFTVDFGVQ